MCILSLVGSDGAPQRGLESSQVYNMAAKLSGTAKDTPNGLAGVTMGPSLSPTVKGNTKTRKAEMLTKSTYGLP